MLCQKLPLDTGLRHRTNVSSTVSSLRARVARWPDYVQCVLNCLSCERWSVREYFVRYMTNSVTHPQPIRGDRPQLRLTTRAPCACSRLGAVTGQQRHALKYTTMSQSNSGHDEVENYCKGISSEHGDMDVAIPVFAVPIRR